MLCSKKGESLLSMAHSVLNRQGREQTWNHLVLSVQSSGADIGSGSLQVEQALFLKLWLPLPLPLSSGFFWTLSYILETLLSISPTLVSPETIISFCFWQWIPWWMYAKGENYRWEGDYGRIAPSIPLPSIPPLSCTHQEVELLKEQEEQGCSQGKAGAASSPQHLRTGLVTIAGPGKSKNSGTNMETTELRARLDAGLRIPTPQLEERSVTKRWVLPSLSPAAACLALGMLGCFGNAGLLFSSFQCHESPKASHSLTITSNLWESSSLVC